MSDAYTQLNQGMGGDVMDEAGISFPDGPPIRKRPRVVLTGETKDAIAEVKNQSPSGPEFGLVTRNIPTIPGEQVHQYSTVSLVPSRAETTICTYTVPTGKSFYFMGVTGSGEVTGRFRLFTDANPQLSSRSSVAVPNILIAFPTPIFTVAEGVTVSLKVTHFEDGIQAEFDGTIIGCTY